MTDKKINVIKERILGKKYELSLVFAKSSFMKELNSRYRGKTTAADVLAFPLSENEGEIFINQANKKNADFLLIHALLHLKGLKHGSKMEKEEERLLKKI